MRAAITVRAAEFDDRAAMGRLWQELMEFHREYDTRFRHLDPDALDAWLERIDECMADSDHIILVAEAGGDVVAFATARPSEDPPVFDLPPHMSITSFVVTGAWRRRGVGQRLFEAVAERSRRRGFGEIRLSVAADNPVSTAFWRKMGLEPYAVNMRKRL